MASSGRIVLPMLELCNRHARLMAQHTERWCHLRCPTILSRHEPQGPSSLTLPLLSFWVVKDKSTDDTGVSFGVTGDGLDSFWSPSKGSSLFSLELRCRWATTVWRWQWSGSSHTQRTPPPPLRLLHLPLKTSLESRSS